VFDIDISNRITRGSSPQAELRQGVLDWVKRLRTIDEHQLNASSPGPVAVPKIQEPASPVPDPSTAAESAEERRWQDDGGEGS